MKEAHATEAYIWGFDKKEPQQLQLVYTTHKRRNVTKDYYTQ